MNDKYDQTKTFDFKTELETVEQKWDDMYWYVQTEAYNMLSPGKRYAISRTMDALTSYKANLRALLGKLNA